MPSSAEPRLTPRQDLLLAELRAAERELSGQELHARLRGGSGAMGLATVYRHLRQLQQKGLVRCRHLPSGEALFAPTERDEHHLTCVDCGSTVRLSHCPVHDEHHLTCVDCGSTVRLSHCPVHDVHLHDADLAGFLPLFHTLEFFGLCTDCRVRQASAAEP